MAPGRVLFAMLTRHGGGNTEEPRIGILVSFKKNSHGGPGVMPRSLWNLVLCLRAGLAPCRIRIFTFSKSGFSTDSLERENHFHHAIMNLICLGMTPAAVPKITDAVFMDNKTTMSGCC
jgi:hypothetical protein